MVSSACSSVKCRKAPDSLTSSFPLLPCCAGFWAPLPLCWAILAQNPSSVLLVVCHALCSAAASSFCLVGAMGGRYLWFSFEMIPPNHTFHSWYWTINSVFLVVICSVITWLNFFEPQFVHLWNCNRSGDDGDDDGEEEVVLESASGISIFLKRPPRDSGNSGW